MFRSWKRLWVSCAAVALIATTFSGSAVWAAEASKTLRVAVAPVSFQFDAVSLAPSAGDEGFIVNGTTYVPLRFMSNAVEKSVRWDAATSTVFVSEPTRYELVSIRETNLNRVVRGGAAISNKAVAMQTITVFERSVTYIFDGETKQPPTDQPGFIYKDKLYVPLRFFGQSVGRTIDWNPASYSIAVRKPPASQPPGSGGTGAASTGTSPAGSAGQSSEQAQSGGSGITLPGIGGGIPAAPKPSYESLIASAEQQIAALRDSCQADMSALADEFFEADGWNKQAALIDEGFAKLAACDASFDGIMNSLSSQLGSNGYPTSVIAQYRSQYEQLKQQEYDKMLNRLLNE